MESYQQSNQTTFTAGGVHYPPTNATSLLGACQRGDLKTAWPYMYDLLSRRYPVHRIALHSGPFPERAWMFFIDPARHCRWAFARDRNGQQRNVVHPLTYSWSYATGMCACYQFHDRHADVIPTFCRLTRYFNHLGFDHLEPAEMSAVMTLLDI